MDWRDSHPQTAADASKVEKAAPLPTQQNSNETQPEPPPMGAGMQAEQLVQPAAPAATVPAPVEPAPATPSAAAPKQSAIPAQVQTPAQSAGPGAVPAAAQSHIVMKFSETSWVRVLDGDGKELINKNKPANSEETIEGKPPFKVEIGNVSGAVVTYNGQPVDLAMHAKSNVARLTLE